MNVKWFDKMIRRMYNAQISFLLRCVGCLDTPIVDDSLEKIVHPKIDLIPDSPGQWRWKGMGRCYRSSLFCIKRHFVHIYFALTRWCRWIVQTFGARSHSSKADSSTHPRHIWSSTNRLLGRKQQFCVGWVADTQSELNLRVGSCVADISLAFPNINLAISIFIASHHNHQNLV